MSENRLVIEISLGLPKTYLYNSKEGLMEFGSPLSLKLLDPKDELWVLSERIQSLIDQNIDLFKDEMYYDTESDRRTVKQISEGVPFNKIINTGITTYSKLIDEGYFLCKILEKEKTKNQTKIKVKWQKDGKEEEFSDLKFINYGSLKLIDYGSDLKIANAIKKDQYAVLGIFDSYTAIFLSLGDQEFTCKKKKKILKGGKLKTKTYLLKEDNEEDEEEEMYLKKVS